VIFSTPASPDKKMGFADPGHDIGWFTRAAFKKGPEFMKRQYVPVCGQSISYDDLASRFFAVTGIKAEYRQCLVEEFKARFENFSEADRKDMGVLAKWLAVAPSGGVCYGTIDMERLSFAERGLNVKALSWEAFLEVSDDISSHSLLTRLISVAALLRRYSPLSHPLLRLLSHIPALASSSQS
jgi:hypothetical protein